MMRNQTGAYNNLAATMMNTQNHQSPEEPGVSKQPIYLFVHKKVISEVKLISNVYFKKAKQPKLPGFASRLMSAIKSCPKSMFHKCLSIIRNKAKIYSCNLNLEMSHADLTFGCNEEITIKVKSQYK
jgi:hypothetical protein